jgi:hypothetical protein
MKSDCCGAEMLLVPYDHGQDCRYECPICTGKPPYLTPEQEQRIRWPSEDECEQAWQSKPSEVFAKWAIRYALRDLMEKE